MVKENRNSGWRPNCDEIKRMYENNTNNSANAMNRSNKQFED